MARLPLGRILDMASMRQVGMSISELDGSFASRCIDIGILLAAADLRFLDIGEVSARR